MKATAPKPKEKPSGDGFIFGFWGDGLKTCGEGFSGRIFCCMDKITKTNDGF